MLVAAPIIALVAIATRGSGDVWVHLLTHVLPTATLNTMLLLAGVGAFVVFIGAGAAWLVTAYDFPGRRILDWALLLPLAVPTYIVAYAYLDLLHPIGPIQSAIRAVLGFTSPSQLRLPEIRSIGGAIILLGFVLYPYVYLSTRALFLMQAAGLLDAARTLGAGRYGVFFRVALPLARPAIAIGASLALMETLNDVGASEFLGVRTLTLSIYSTWINQSNLPGAAQLALVMLAVVVLLVVIERRARRGQRFAGRSQRTAPAARQRLTGAKAALALILGLIPVLIGFGAPAIHLLIRAIHRIDFAGLSGTIVNEAANTVGVSAAATAIAVGLGLVVAYGARLDPGRLGGVLLRVASLGYALPGTVIAIGLLSPLAGLDNLVDGISRGMLGVSTGLLLSGSAAALIYAYVTRFLAVSAGGADAGLSKVSVTLDHSARTLGETATGTLRRIHLPLIRPALGAAAILVFVDCMKELPATLLLRPLNFETLATHLYGEAARGTYEDGAVAALAIVLVGLLPVILLARLSGPTILRQGRLDS
ncbi:iron ABC transporter permease [Bauldia sp.]|uniref:ABC transporter permease n=1 Tax=Bauldia sp. TaxID=2575872 RepID=UPI0025C18473|nr:iron ABC transporter permease [Bauldia sp.]